MKVQTRSAEEIAAFASALSADSMRPAALACHRVHLCQPVLADPSPAVLGLGRPGQHKCRQEVCIHASLDLVERFLPDEAEYGQHMASVSIR
jgi:hypothetical protein